MYMDIINKNDFKRLFKNLCCSRCKNDFDFESFEIKEYFRNLLLCKLICSKCGKDFGDIVLYFDKKNSLHSELEVIEGPPPISSNDVIEAHRFIKKM